MYLNCYDDEEGYTLVEQWVQDMETEEWTEISCFHTGLKHSCFMGAMSQFMENYWGAYSNDVRTFAYRNFYVREKGSDEWIGLHSSNSLCNDRTTEAMIQTTQARRSIRLYSAANSKLSAGPR